jgi:hypothetical protein
MVFIASLKDRRRQVLVLLFLIYSTSIFAQIDTCKFSKLTFETNPYRQKDTLGDLVLSPNAYGIYKELHNVFIITKKLQDVSFKVNGAAICVYKNDSTYIIKPFSPDLEFIYYYKEDTLTKKYKVQFRPKTELKVYLDNRMQASDKELINYKSIDSLSFDIDKSSIRDYTVIEDFHFAITSITISLVRGKRPVDQIQFSGASKIFFVRNLLKKGKPGDKLVVTFYPEWQNVDGTKSYMGCHYLISYPLGRSN